VTTDANELPEAAALKKAVEGLLYPSESDEPFEVFAWDRADSARAAVSAHAKKRAKIIEQPVDEFFSALKGADDEPRYQQLRRVLEASLTDLNVFRVGRIRVDVYVLGRARSGRWVGVHTTSVET
jgi:Nuclease A inhibitor-like protein